MIQLQAFYAKCCVFSLLNYLFVVVLLISCLVPFQVMHIAAATEINSRLIPNLRNLHTALHSKV